MTSTQGVEIGNWLFDKNGIAKQVTEVYDDSVTLGGELHQISTVEPIPLTSDVLDKNGLESPFASTWRDEYCLHLNPTDNILFVDVNKLRDYVRIKFNPLQRPLMTEVVIEHCSVHQFQNVLQITGIKKEIAL